MAQHGGVCPFVSLSFETFDKHTKPRARDPKAPHKHEDPVNQGFWNAPCLEL